MTAAPSGAGRRMLPRRLLRTVQAGESHRPAYLTARDEPWVRELVLTQAAQVGRTDDERRLALRTQCLLLGRQCRRPPEVLEGLSEVLGRLYPARARSSVRSVDARRAAFEAGARQSTFDRSAALSSAAASLGQTSQDVEQALFADVPGAREVGGPAEAPSPTDMVERYNLALLQGLLATAEHLTVYVSSHVRAVARFAKLQRLICVFSDEDGEARVDISGPLSLFRFTLKYGRALARFVPALLSTPGWRLSARCCVDRLEGEPLPLLASDGDLVSRPHALPRAFDSSVERGLARDVAKLGSSWTLRREASAIAWAGRTFYPDFVFERGDQRVIVEVVGYYTADYLAEKLRALRDVRGHRVVVAIDEDLACEDADIAADGVVRFRKRIDAAALLLAVEAAADIATPGSAPASGSAAC